MSLGAKYKGLDVPHAYINIVLPAISYSRDSFTFHVQLHVSAGGPVLSVEQYVCEYDLDGENPFRQGYAHLKTLAEFAGAIDC